MQSRWTWNRLYQDVGMMVISHSPLPVIYWRIRHHSDDFFRPTKEIASHGDLFHLLASLFHFVVFDFAVACAHAQTKPEHCTHKPGAGRGLPLRGLQLPWLCCHLLGRGGECPLITVLNTEDLSLKQKKTCFSNLWESVVESKTIPGIESWRWWSQYLANCSKPQLCPQIMEITSTTV